MQTTVQYTMDESRIWEITAAITAILDEQASGWNAGDAALFSKSFDEAGCFTNIFGMFLKGHEIFLSRHAMILATVFKHSGFKYRLEHLKILREDVALVETLITVSNFNKSGAFVGIHTDEAGNMYTRLQQVMVKKEEGWKIVSYHNVDVKAGVPVL